MVPELIEPSTDVAVWTTSVAGGPTTTRLRARRAGRPRGVTRKQPYLSRELRRQITYTTQRRRSAAIG
jgi:ribosomal protein S14